MLILNQLSWAAAVNKPLSWFSIAQGVGGTGQVPHCRDPAPAESDIRSCMGTPQISAELHAATSGPENFHMPELDSFPKFVTHVRAADESVMR